MSRERLLDLMDANLELQLKICSSTYNKKQPMKKTFQNWLFRMALKQIAKALVHNPEPLTIKYLESKGYVKMFDSVMQKELYADPNIKSRDAIWIEFLPENIYRVWYGANKTFLALESSKQWFDTFFLLAHPDNGRFTL